MSLRNKLTVFVRLLVFISGSSLLCGQADNIVAQVSENPPLWHPIHVDENSHFLFVAFEETESFRERLGRWLPRRFLPIEPDDECFWALRTAKVQDGKMLIYLSIWNKTQDLRNDAYWSSSIYSSALSRDVEEFRLVTRADDTGFTIIYPESGETRSIGFLTAASVDDAKEKFSISKSSIMWSWRIFTW